MRKIWRQVRQTFGGGRVWATLLSRHADTVAIFQAVNTPNHRPSFEVNAQNEASPASFRPARCDAALNTPRDNGVLRSVGIALWPGFDGLATDAPGRPPDMLPVCEDRGNVPRLFYSHILAKYTRKINGLQESGDV